MCINDLFESWKKRTKASTESSTQKDVCYKPIFPTTHTYEVIGRGMPQIDDNIRQIFENANIDLKDIEIYKYYSFKNLQYVLQNKKLYFDRVSKWEDPYENFLLKNRYYVSDQEVSLENLVKCEYGQSWTTKEESDAMWRLYSNDKKGIKIKTTVEKLYSAIYVDQNCLSNTKIGFVRYCDINSYLSQLIHNNGNSLVSFYKKEFVKSMFVKRKEFDYEHEFRVIISLDSNSIADNCERLAYNIDTGLFIDEICLDPRLNNQEFLSLRKKLTDLGVTETKIIQSKLYDFKVADFQFDKY